MSPCVGTNDQQRPLVAARGTDVVRSRQFRDNCIRQKIKQLHFGPYHCLKVETTMVMSMIISLVVFLIQIRKQYKDVNKVYEMEYNI